MSALALTERFLISEHHVNSDQVVDFLRFLSRYHTFQNQFSPFSQLHLELLMHIGVDWLGIQPVLHSNLGIVAATYTEAAQSRVFTAGDGHANYSFCLSGNEVQPGVYQLSSINYPLAVLTQEDEEFTLETRKTILKMSTRIRK